MPNNAIVLVFDRLQAAYLGPYGNHTVPTPAWNALAAESLLLENHLASSPRLETAYRSWWRGAGRQPGESPVALSEALENASIHSALLTDDTSLLENPLAERFAERIAVRHKGGIGEATEPHESHSAAVLEAALAWLEDSPPEPFLLWVHARGMEGPWDAPYDLRLAMADDEDPDPPRFLDPPENLLPAGFDPEELVGVSQAYAGQVMLTDMCLGLFLEALADSSAAERTLLACTSPRGYPLGEHGVVGREREVLTSEATHVPLIIRFPDRGAAAVRELALTGHADLHDTLNAWFELPTAEGGIGGRSLLSLPAGDEAGADQAHLILGDEQVAIRTAHWLLVTDRRDLESQAGASEVILDRQLTQLYSKPDDRCEYNNVFDLCQREAHELAGKLRAMLATR